MNKKLKLSILYLIIFVTLFSVFATFAFAADEGMTFNTAKDGDVWHMRKPLAEAPYSFETWIKVPANAGTARLGGILSNYDGGSTGSTYHGNATYSNRTILLEIHQNGNPRFYYGIDKDGNGTLSKDSLVFTDVDVRTGEWLHLAVVKEASAVVCYVNGVEAQRIATTNVYHSDNLLLPFALGGDNRKSNQYPFKGSFKSLTLYRDVRTAEEIASAYEYGVKTSDPNMILHYDTSTAPTGDYIEDLSGNGYYAALKTYVSEVEAENNVTVGATGTGSLGSGAIDDSEPDYDYSFAVVGDTQYMTKFDAAYGTTHLKNVYDWLIRNKDTKNIKYVMGLGDITDSYNKTGTYDTAKEWQTAFEQISRLDGVIPYSVVRGNHDNETYFDQYFVNNSYKSQFVDPAYTDNSACFYSSDSVLNAYTKFTVGTEKYLLLLLDDNADDDVLEWAGGVIAANSDYRVIINTHTYLGYTEGLIDDSDTFTYATSNVDEGENNGQQIWDKLVSKHENIVLVLCGHDYKAYDIVYNERYGEAGNAVTELLICPQSRDKNENNETKAGMVAMLYFSNGGKDVRVEYISTVSTEASEDKADVYVNETVNHIGFKIQGTPTQSKYGLIPEYYSDTKVYPFALFSGGDHIRSYSTWDAALAGANKKLVAKATDAYLLEMLLLEDVKATKYDNTSQLGGKLIIDLGGKTLTSSTSSPILSGSGKRANTSNVMCDTTITVMNGNIVISGETSFTSFSIWSDYYPSTKSFNYTFNNVNFSFAAGATCTELIASSANSSSDNNAELTLNVSMTFNNCIFDLRTNAPEGARLFNFNDTMSTVDGVAVINGGNIIKSSYAAGSLCSLGDNDRISFGEYADRYTTLTLPSGTLPESEAFTSTDTLAGELTLVKISDDGANAIYRLISKSAADLDFAPKMSLTLARDLVLNVYVPAADILAGFTLDGEEYTDFTGLKQVTVDNETFYLIPISLSAKEAARDVTLKASVTVGEKTATATFTFGIIKYAEKILADGSTVEKTLVCDVLSYVRAAYAYFDTDAAETIAKIDAILGESYDENNAPSTEGSTAAPSTGLSEATFVLDGTPSMRFYLAENADASAYKFYIDDVEVNTVTGTNTTGTYIDLDTYAYAVCETVTYTVDGAESGSFHINAYYEWSKTQNNAELENLVARFMKYSESARAYKDSVVTE